MRRFPSKKPTVLLGVILAILLVFLIISQYKNREISYDQLSPKLAGTDNGKMVDKISTALNRQITQTDADGDGLKDWEEVLWKTDPNSPDTDGDGTNDNDEILANRNPLVAGPDDLIKNTVASETQPSKSFYDQTLTQTNLLAREFFMGYVALKQSGGLGTANQEKFLDALIKKNLAIETKNKYILSDLQIICDTCGDKQKNIQIYADELQAMAIKIPKMRYEPIVLKEALEKKDPVLLSEELNRNIAMYKQIIKWLLEMKTSFDLANYHLRTINIFNNIIIDTENMKKVFEDPIAALTSAQQYIKNEQELRSAFREIGVYFKANAIKL